MAHSDAFGAFNAEQRAYADDQRRALDFDLTMDCQACGRAVPYGQMAVSGCPCEADDHAEIFVETTLKGR